MEINKMWLIGDLQKRIVDQQNIIDCYPVGSSKYNEALAIRNELMDIKKDVYADKFKDNSR